MISVTRPGGSGFFSLTYQGQRLAYLREDPNEQIVITSKGPIPGPSRFTFYELWNAALWRTITGTPGINVMVSGPIPSPALFKGLQNAIDHGDVGLTRLIKDPAGNLRSYEYDLKGCVITELRQETKAGVGGGYATIRFQPAPAFLQMTIAPAPMMTLEENPKKAPVEELDIAAGVYALRSFKLTQGRLGSLYREFYWDKGMAVAECTKDHPIPDSDCLCGLYGLQSLDKLISEYSDSRRCVAVFAAEGRTIIGDRGLKTAVAKVKAYWVQTLTELEVMQREVPDAKHFTDMQVMLAEYHFPPWKEKVPELFDPSLVPFTGHEPVVSRWAYSPEHRPPTPPPTSRPPRAQRSAAGSAVVGNFKFTTADITKVMGPAATPAGLAAIQHVQDIVTGKKKS